MGRQKGSRNRSTLLRQLVECGVGVHVGVQWAEGLSHRELTEKVDQMLATKAPAPTVTPEQEFLDGTTSTALANQVRDRMAEMIGHFAGPTGLDLQGHVVEVPEHIQDYLRRVYYAKGLAEANQVAKRTLDKLFEYLVGLVQHGRLTSPMLRIWVV